MDLFEYGGKQRKSVEAPLAARMRPRTLNEFVGQEHILGKGKLLRRAIESGRLFSSLIFWGPPGTGKTTLAFLISRHTDSHFETLSAVLSGVADLRRAIKEAVERYNMHGKRTILLVDEIHRWNKAQQDALLPYVEDGTIVLIGVTTENPYFEVIRPLLSRARVFQFRPLGKEEILMLLKRALEDKRGYKSRNVKISPDALEHIAESAEGDARFALNALELAVESTSPDEQGVIHITPDIAQEAVQRRVVAYDKSGDEHYDTISAFIKSVRGSDPDAALYWLAKMLLAGEDPRFIMRRLYILAAEDIGLADPKAITIVAACSQALEWVGLPEAEYHLAEATIYLATAPKSNSTKAIFEAKEFIEKHGTGEVPLHLKDGSRDSETLGHGKGYLYPHSFPGHWVKQRYLPEGVEGKWYKPSDQGFEKKIKEWLAHFEEKRTDK